MSPPSRTILINDLAVYRQRSGVGHYMAELIRHLKLVQGSMSLVRLGNSWAGLAPRAMGRWYRRGQKVEQAYHAGVDRSWSRRAISKLMPAVRQAGHRILESNYRVLGKFIRPAVYHEPDALPLPIDAPTVTTVHDLSVMIEPRWHPPERVARYHRLWNRGLSQTDLFVAVSHANKDAMVRWLGIPEDKIRVSWAGPRSQFHRLPEQEILEARRRLNLPDRFLLFLGTIEPRKNVEGLLRAYARLPSNLRRDVPLILAGGWGWRSHRIREMLSRSPWCQQVKWLGYLPDHDLVALTNAAEALVYPSFYEGFGLPPLEAMACGIPVIASSTSSLPEVVGTGGWMVDPHDLESLTRAMLEVLSHRELAEQLIRAGTRNLQRFSWLRHAREMMAIYQHAGGFLADLPLDSTELDFPSDAQMPTQDLDTAA